MVALVLLGCSGFDDKSTLGMLAGYDAARLLVERAHATLQGCIFSGANTGALACICG
ncbi:hypothetical protein [Mycobacterium uberis]|uniref:hypothetical protein n=1 Tax=Mycobacterium uberis TaxID=2162698 RepID=UPI0014022959|nr:hypothetical protein [Mycobacterium uberis]